MSGTSHAGSYRAVLALPHAALTFGAALVGRLSYGLLPLSVLFSVQHATGSFAVAGGVVAVLGLTSILLPLKARLVDRHGQPRVLLPLALITAAALAALAALCWFGSASPVLLGGLAVLAGLGAPPLGPAMRATWRDLTEGTELKGRAYSLDSVCEESLYLVGPLLVGLLLTVAPAPVAVLTTAALMLGGTAAMVLTPPARAARVGDRLVSRRFDLGPLRSPGLLPVVCVILATAAGVSMAYTGIAARAQESGAPAAAGYIEAGIALGSVVGGLMWGRRRHTRTRSTHLAGLIALLAFGVTVGGGTSGLVLLGVVMSFAGVAVAPLFVVSYLATDELAPAHQRTEASTWVNTANNVGGAAGTAVAGVIADRVGVTTGFVSAGVLLAVVATGVWLGRRTIDGATAEPERRPPNLITG